MNKIESFRGEYGFLSNFYSSPIKYNGKDYATVEHAYQACKSANEEEHEMVRLLNTAGEAKAAGKKVKIREDWDEVKIAIMTDLIYCKFTQNKDLCEKLSKTGDMDIIEGNTWGDYFWGVCHGMGDNHLGKIIMEFRSKNLHY